MARRIRVPYVGAFRTGGTAGLLLGAAALFILVKMGSTLGNFLRDPFGLGGTPGKTEEDNRTKTFDEISSPDASRMSITKDKAAVIAGELYTAMHPSGLWSAANDGTDEAAIFEAFDMLKNRDDLLAVIKSFGVRRYRDNLAGREDGDLIFWLKEELSGSDLAKIKPKLNLI